MNTTIAAISTAVSASGIGIIRISGPEAMDVISRIYRSKGGKKKIKEVPTHTIHYGYIYDGEEFYIYNVATAEVYDIYNPDYADKFWHGWTDTLKVSICGEKYLVLLNMEGTDGQNYYAVMDFLCI